MKRHVALILAALQLLTLLSGCGMPTTSQTPSESAKQTVSLDGKRVLFVGCSYTYYGGTVAKTPDSERDQAKRSGDQGWFHQLCQANGAQTQVTDWCYGGHSLTDLFDGSCSVGSCRGRDHLADLTDRNFDYVVLQEIKEPDFHSPQDFLDNVRSIMELFRAENPAVQFLYVVHDGVYTGSYSAAWRESVRLIQDEGVTVVDWGTLVWDVIQGDTAVPGGTLPYYKSSFIVSRSASDGYHPNLLSGYLYALMTYCAITGEPAKGQPYDFCTDGTAEDPALDPTTFFYAHYFHDNKNTPEDDRDTNFIDIFNSPADMAGLQELADRYLPLGAKAIH